MLLACPVCIVLSMIYCTLMKITAYCRNSISVVQMLKPFRMFIPRVLADFPATAKHTRTAHFIPLCHQGKRVKGQSFNEVKVKGQLRILSGLENGQCSELEFNC